MTDDAAIRYCPRCATARIGSFRYCQSCAFDYDADPQHPTPRAAAWPEELADRSTGLEERVAPTPSATVASAPAPTPSATVASAPAPTPALPPARAPIVPIAQTPHPALRFEVAAVPRPARPVDAGQRFPRSGRWPVYIIGGLAILLTTGALIASMLLSPRQVFAPVSSSAPTGSPAASASGIPGLSRIVINEPENGASVQAQQVTFRGTGPAGFELIHDSIAGPDERTTIAPDGNWSLVVDLTSGVNEITLRLGDDRSTEITWTVNSVPASFVTSGSGPPTGGAFSAISLAGRGDQVSPFAIPEGAVAIATISHRGTGPFAVWTLDANDNQTDLLVNVIGNYAGTRLFNAETHVVGFRVEASASWTIVIKPVSAAEHWDAAGTLEGAGSDVFVLDPPASLFRSATIRHEGRGAFVVAGYSAAGRDVHANAVGNYFGESLLREGTSILAIEATGTWTIVLD